MHDLRPFLTRIMTLSQISQYWWRITFPWKFGLEHRYRPHFQRILKVDCISPAGHEIWSIRCCEEGRGILYLVPTFCQQVTDVGELTSTIACSTREEPCSKSARSWIYGFSPSCIQLWLYHLEVWASVPLQNWEMPFYADQARPYCLITIDTLRPQHFCD